MTQGELFVLENENNKKNPTTSIYNHGSVYLN